MTDEPKTPSTDSTPDIDIQHYFGDPDLAIGEAKEFIHKYGEFPHTVPIESVCFLTWKMGYDICPASILRCESLDRLTESLDPKNFKPTVDTNANGNQVILLGGGMQIKQHAWVQLQQSYLTLRSELQKHMNKH